MLRFTDGEEFNAQGDLRIEERRDGLYVVGDGVVIPVDSEEEARELIEQLQGKKARPARPIHTAVRCADCKHSKYPVAAWGGLVCRAGFLMVDNPRRCDYFEGPVADQ